MNAEERRRLVIERLKAGETQMAIAQDLGVTRQAISLMWKKYQAAGEAYFTSKARGRHKERDHLTELEEKEVCEWLNLHKPEEIGESGESWTIWKVKRAILHVTGKRVREQVIRELLNPTPPVKPLPEKIRKESEAQSEGKGDKGESGQVPLPSIKEMDAMNAETWKTVPWEMPMAGPVHGMRTGRHAKGTRSPGKKKRKSRK